MTASQWRGDVCMRRWEMPILCQHILECNDSKFSKLRLDGHMIDDGQAAILGDAISKYKPLQELSLSGCRITGEGMLLLSKSLVQTQLKVLSLWGNELGDDGGVALASSLPGMLSLYSLKLSDIAARRLLEVLPKCPSLKFLNLRGNKCILSQSTAVEARRVHRICLPRIIDTDVLSKHRAFDARSLSHRHLLSHRVVPELSDAYNKQALDLTRWQA